MYPKSFNGFIKTIAKINNNVKTKNNFIEKINIIRKVIIDNDKNTNPIFLESLEGLEAILSINFKPHFVLYNKNIFP